MRDGYFSHRLLGVDMRIEIEFSFRGLNHICRVDRYDNIFGCMVKGFQFRLRPMFFCVLVCVK